MLNDIHYGNMNAGTKDTAFWLYGDLRISSYDQIQFLEKICLRTLNFKNSSYDLLKEIMTEYKGEKYSLYGKTGWVDDIGWYVGYIETSSNEVWVFATRIEGAKINSNQMGKRKEI
jgi:beta-lactamase class D